MTAMFTTEIQQDVHSGPVTLNPRWLRIPAAVKYSGLSRARLYELLAQGPIKSICLKSRKGAQRGIRLIDKESIDAFMIALQTEEVCGWLHVKIRRSSMSASGDRTPYILFLAMLPLVASAKELSTSEIYQSVKAAVVKLTVFDQHGTPL